MRRPFATAVLLGVLLVPVPHHSPLLAQPVDEDPELTFLSGIRRLPAGHRLLVAGAPPRPRRWWYPAAAPRPGCRTAADWADALRARMETAVRARLAGPVASMLSGGLDTSTIVGVARRLRPELPTLSVRFDDHPEADESRWFEAVIREGGVAARVLPGATVRPDLLLPRFLAREDEPLWAPYVFLHAAVYDAARQGGAAAVLDGLEGDATVSFGWGRLPH